MAEIRNILVTGAAGFIGSHLCERLLEEGYAVYGLDNFDPFYEPSLKRRNLSGVLHHPSFTLIEADIREADRLQAIFELYDFDAIIHLAAMGGVRHSIRYPELFAEVNVSGTLNLLEAAKTKEIKPFIYASSSSVYGKTGTIPFAETDSVDHPISPYAATKKAAELMCYTWHHLYDLSVMCLRLFSVYGPRQRPDLAISSFSRNLQAELPVPIFGDGSSGRDYTYIDDTIEGIYRALNYIENHRVYEVINLGSSESISLSAMMAYLEELSGKKFIREPQLLPFEDMQLTLADLSKARSLLDYQPKVSFSEGIRRWWDWFSANNQ
ncbi:MAG: NAD-dependent epimerase/dehydratase family protein [Candidatus Cloacimonadota bacterium]